MYLAVCQTGTSVLEVCVNLWQSCDEAAFAMISCCCFHCEKQKQHCTNLADLCISLFRIEFLGKSLKKCFSHGTDLCWNVGEEGFLNRETFFSILWTTGIWVGLYCGECIGNNTAYFLLRAVILPCFKAIRLFPFFWKKILYGDWIE